MKIGCVPFGEKKEKQDGQRDKKEQEEIDIPKFSDEIAEGSERVFKPHLCPVVKLKNFIERVSDDARKKHAKPEERDHFKAKASYEFSH
ncbi:hypothetical protein BRE01_08300 [Brevibacillus reuszeri]|uniref:Uncharacterized protein n=1 Tax=Brevibacillus reuszeri TaxID=54915 RepID=A0ABQ0TJU4_9BACL|nr:hypothetical protein BRE01_08300 [Brevibacillus reuszeri]